MADNMEGLDAQEDLLEQDATPYERAYDFNPDEMWQQYVLTYEPIIEAVVRKYCAADESLREDCAQEGRIALATLRPENCSAYAAYVAGALSEEQWQHALSRYCRNAIRNGVLSMLDSYPKGNWYIGRTRSVRDRHTGEVRKVHFPPRFSSYDELVDRYGMQVDEEGNISWPAASDDGIEHTAPRGTGNQGHWYQADPDEGDPHAP